MKKTAHFTQRSYLQLLFGLSVLSRTLSALANPVGGTVNQGKVTFSSQGSQFTINQSSGSAYINWQSFNIGAGETTTFLQPSSSSVVWNHINDPNASQILGNLNANGYVILQNQNGFFVGGQAVINTHGLLMTTAPIPMPDLSSGGPWDIKSPPPTASIINYGQINTDKGGSVFLISHDIQNHGTISAPEGNIGLYAGQEVLVSDRPDGRGLSARVTLPSGSIDNSGKLIADAGTIALNAQVVNQGGLIEANSVRDVNGTIELVASDSVNLGSSSVITAKGDSQGVSAGGSVTIKSDAGFSDKAGSTIDVAGGAQGGNGGQVEISASRMSSIDSTISGHAAQGFTSGKLFIDPANILLADFGDNAPGSGTVNPGDPPSAGSPDTLTLNVNSLNNLISQNALSQINLQATKNIEVSTLWTLPDSQDPKASLTLRAGNKITIDDASAIDAGKNWTINMFAGPQNPSSRPAAGTAGIYVNGTGYIQTQNGNINLWAANEVIVASGPPDLVLNNGIRTLGGGSINVTTVFGSVNSGSNPLGFEYQLDAPYYTVSTPASLLALTLGGISTAAGGDVTINSGKDVFSFLPVSSSGQYAAADGGSGAFGPEPGNVTITAAGSVYGHYVVANGHGKITAGQDAGGQIASKNLALSLIKGDWDVEAPNGSIYLQEVRNPNGVFNTVGAFGQAGRHLFDYDPEDSVSLTAGNVYLTCQSLPRTSDPVPVLFPPKLSISAVVGGVFLQDTITLFPSASQGLEISSAGDFAGTPNTPFTQPLLVMSDSGRQRWVDVSSFAPRDHGNSPLGVNDTTPVEIDVGGNMNNLTLVTTKATHLSVAGDMINCGFSGQNLRSGDTTSIDVTGQIFNRSPYSFVILDQGLPQVPTADLPRGAGVTFDLEFNLLLDPAKLSTIQIPDNVLPSQWAALAAGAAIFPQLAGNANPGFVYNATTRRLGFSGQMQLGVLAAFQKPMVVLTYNPDGTPATYVASDGSRHFVFDTISFIPASAAQALYAASQGAPSPSNYQIGYRIGGPGTFDVTAGSMQLGNSIGILSCGVQDVQGGYDRYANLASVTRDGGASVNVTVNEGNLEMLTSTIGSLGGGDVTVLAPHGAMDLGSQELINTRRELGFGIYTASSGNVSVIASGDINIDGSRIASYDGGDILVRSLEGNVDAGTGGTAFIGVKVNFVDPVTGAAKSYAEQVFGSGIVANTLVNPSQVPGAASLPGDIRVETPQGSIFASLGGIVQEALNGNVSAGPTITLIAGTRPSGPNDPGFKGNIDLGESGVIGGTVNADANGNITGLVISRQNSTITAAQSFSGTVLSGGTANLSAGGTISGTIVGVGGISASGGLGVSATLLSQNVSVGGAQAQSTLGTSSTATSTSQAAAQQSTTDTQKAVALSDTTSSEDETKKKTPALTRKVGRVTVILPPSS